MFDQLGLPYFTLFFIGTAIAILVVKYNVEYLLYIYALAVNIIVLYKLVQIHRRTKK
jgi:bacteriorhodopsin